MRQVTAKSPEQVMWWIETQPHHHGEWIDGAIFVLKNHDAMLRIPRDIWNISYVVSGGDFDRRMYRWDHRAAAVAAGFTL